jgi:hypothetical protein
LPDAGITTAERVTIKMVSLKPNPRFNPKLANGSSCNGAFKPVTKKMKCSTKFPNEIRVHRKA